MASLRAGGISSRWFPFGSHVYELIPKLDMVPKAGAFGPLAEPHRFEVATTVRRACDPAEVSKQLLAKLL